MRIRYLLLVAVLLATYLFWSWAPQAPAGRRYPERVKGFFVRCFPTLMPWERTRGRLGENLQIAELGANTYRTFSSYKYEGGEFHSVEPFRWGMYNDLSREIRSVRARNLSVIMRSSWTPGGGIWFSDKREMLNFLEQYIDLMEEDAKFSEGLGVEYFELGEPDHLIRTQGFPVSEDETVRMIDSFKEEALDRLRRVYTGKIYYQIGDAWDWDFTKLNVSGLDFFGVMIGGSCDFREFQRAVDLTFERAERLSNESGVPWMISELWINERYDCNLSGRRAPYFEYVFQKARDARHLKGILISTWNFEEPGFEASIKGTPAEEVVREFFGSW